MTDFSLNSNITQKKNLLKAKVSAKNSEAKAKETAKTAEVKKDIKTSTAKEVVSGLTDGTMSASKAISTLKTKAPLKATKKGNLTTITAKVDNKAMKITTNAGNVPITVDNNTIATAKTIDAGVNIFTTANSNKLVNSINNVEKFTEAANSKSNTINLDPKNFDPPNKPDGPEKPIDNPKFKIDNLEQKVDFVNTSIKDNSKSSDTGKNYNFIDITKPDFKGKFEKTPGIAILSDIIKDLDANVKINIDTIDENKPADFVDTNQQDASIEENKQRTRDVVNNLYSKLTGDTSSWIALQMSLVTGQYISQVQYDESSENQLLQELSKQGSTLSAEEVNASLEFLLTTLDYTQSYTEADIIKLLIDFNKSGGVKYLNDIAEAQLNNIGNALQAVGEYLQQGDSDCTFNDIREFLTNYYYDQFIAELGQDNSDLAMEKAKAAAMQMLPEEDVENSTFGMMLAASIRDTLNSVEGYEDVTFEDIVDYMKSTSTETTGSDSSPANAPRRARAGLVNDIKSRIKSAKEAIGNDAIKAGAEFCGMICQSIATVGGGAMILLGGTVEAVKTSVTTGKPLANTLAENINRTTEYMHEHGQKALNHLYEFSQNTVTGALITSAIELAVPGTAPAIASANFIAITNKMATNIDGYIENKKNALPFLSDASNQTIGLVGGALDLLSCAFEAFGTKAIAAAIKNSAVYKTLAKELSALIQECGGMLDASKLGKIISKCLSGLGDSKIGKWIGECADDIAKLISEKWTSVYSLTSTATGVMNSDNGTNNTQQTSNGTEYIPASEYGNNIFDVINNASISSADNNAGKTYSAAGTINLPNNSTNAVSGEGSENSTPSIEQLIAQQIFSQFGNSRIITGIENVTPIMNGQGTVTGYNYTYSYQDNTSYNNTYIPGGSSISDYDNNNIIFPNTENINANLFSDDEWNIVSNFLYTSSCSEATYYFQPSNAYSPGVNLGLFPDMTMDNFKDVTSQYTCNTTTDSNGNTVVTETYVNQQGQLVTCTTTLCLDGTVNMHATVNVGDKVITYDRTDNYSDATDENGNKVNLVQQFIDNANQGNGYVMTSSMRSSYGYLADEQHLEIRSGDEVIVYDVVGDKCSVSKTVGGVTSVVTDPYNRESGTTTYVDEKGNVHTVTRDSDGVKDTWTDEEGTHEYKYEKTEDTENGKTIETKILTNKDNSGNTTVQQETKTTDNKTGESVTDISTKTTDKDGNTSENKQVKSTNATITRDADGNVTSVNTKKIDEYGNEWNTTSYPDGSSVTIIKTKTGEEIKISTEFVEHNGVWGQKTTYTQGNNSETHYPDKTVERSTDMGADGIATERYDANGNIIEYCWTSKDGQKVIKNKNYESFAQEMHEYNSDLWDERFQGQDGYLGITSFAQYMAKQTGWAPGLFEQYEYAVTHGNSDYANYLWEFNKYYSGLLEDGFASGFDYDHEVKYYQWQYSNTVGFALGNTGGVESIYGGGMSDEQLFGLMMNGTADQAIWAMSVLASQHQNSQRGGGGSGNVMVNIGRYITFITTEQALSNQSAIALNGYLASIGQNIDAIYAQMEAAMGSSGESSTEDSGPNRVQARNNGTSSTAPDGNITQISQSDNSVSVSTKQDGGIIQEGSNDGNEVAINSNDWRSSCSEKAQEYIDAHMNMFTLIVDLSVGYNISDLSDLLDKAFEEYFRDVQGITEYQLGQSGLDALNANKDALKQMFLEQFTAEDSTSYQEKGLDNNEQVINKLYSILMNPQALDFRPPQADSILEDTMGENFDFGLQVDVNGNYVITVNSEVNEPNSKFSDKFVNADLYTKFDSYAKKDDIIGQKLDTSFLESMKFKSTQTNFNIK